MKRFKTFLNESPMVTDEMENTKEEPRLGHPKNESKRQTMSTIGDHTVKKFSLGPGRSAYTLHAPDNKITLTAAGKAGEGNKFYEDSLDSSTKAPIKAHEFYHHLVTNHDIHLHSDTLHSPGAKKVWSKLHGMEGTKTQAYNDITKKYTDIPHSESLDSHYGKYNTRISVKKA